MPILKVKSKGTTTSEGRLVGAFVPSQVSSYLSLYALANCITKSMIVRDLIEDWYRDKRGEMSEDTLIEKIVLAATAEWRGRKSKFPSSDFHTYQIDLIKQLEQKKVTPYNIELILKKLQDEENKEANQPQ